MQVIIGVDPHKASHTAVAIDRRGRARPEEGAGVAPRSTSCWRGPSRSRRGCGRSRARTGWATLLAQQLVAAGEHVVNVPATLACADPGAARPVVEQDRPERRASVAVTALRTTGLRQVRPVGHSEVLRVLAKRNTDIGDHRTRVVCRIHALLLELDPGGIAKEINASDVDAFLAEVTPTTPAEQVRFDLAVELLADIRRLDAQLKASHKRIQTAVAASGTTLTDVFGIGPIIAAMLIGYTGDIARFADRDRYAAYNGTAPVEFSSGGRIVHRVSQRGNRQLNHALHMAAICQLRHPSIGRAGLLRSSGR